MILEIFRRLFRPVVWLTAEKAFAEVFNLALFSIQAPLLGPSTFGLVAAALVFVYFWEIVLTPALTEALLAVRGIDRQHFSTATTAAVAFCVVFGVMLFAFARPFALLFGAPELAPVMRVMAALPVIHAFSIVPIAAAQRAMRFQTVTLRTTASLLAGGAVGLGLTLAGAGVWALVWQAVVQRLVAVVVLWRAAPVRFGLGFSRRHLRELAAFALPVILARLVVWASGQSPRLLIGMSLGPTALGLFAVATRLSSIVNQLAIEPQARVARVHLCRFVGDPEAFWQAVRQAFRQMSLAAFPVCLGGAAVAPALFQAWLDPRWSSAVLPSQIILLSSVPWVTFYGSTALLYALNLQRREAEIAMTLHGCIVALLAVCVPFGLTATAVALAAVPLALTPLPVLVARRSCRVSFRDVLLPQAPALLAASIMAATVWPLRLRLQASCSSVTTLFVACAAGGVLYVGLIAVLMPGSLGRLARRAEAVWQRPGEAKDPLLGPER